MYAYILLYDEAHCVPNVVFKIKKHNHGCILVFTGWLMRLLTTSYTLSNQQYRTLGPTCLSAVTCMPINHLPVRKAYSLDENRLTNA